MINVGKLAIALAEVPERYCPQSRPEVRRIRVCSGKSSFAPSLKCFEFLATTSAPTQKTLFPSGIFLPLFRFSRRGTFFTPETYGRRDLYQAEGLLDQALNLVDVNVRDSIEEKMR